MAAAAAQAVGLLTNRTTGTTPVPVLGKCGDENRMHEASPLDAIRPPERPGSAVVDAQCIGLSGRGYYATGPGPDVLGRLHRVKPSFCVPDSTCRCHARGCSAPATTRERSTAGGQGRE
jgi:hypothetical protein